MRIDRGHRNQAAAILIGLAGVLGSGGPVRADPVIDPSFASTTGEAIDAARWSADAQSPAMDFDDIADTQYNAAPGKSARELLLRDRRSIPSATGQSDRTLIGTGTYAFAPSGSAAAAEDLSERASWAHEMNHAVKEAVRPLFEELAGSSFVAAVRDLESELGLNKRWSFSDPTSSDYSQNTGQGAHPDAASWRRPGASADPDSRARAANQIEADRVTARIRIERYIEEIKWWLPILVVLLLVAGIAKLGLDYSRWKAARRRKHGAKGVRRRRRKRRPQVHPTNSVPDPLSETHQSRVGR